MLLSHLSRVPAPRHPLHRRAQLWSYQIPFFCPPFNLCFQGCCWQGAPPQLSPLRGVDDPPHRHGCPISSIQSRCRGTAPSVVVAPPPPAREGGLPALRKQVSPPLSPCSRDPPGHLCCGERLLCPGLCSWSKQNPKLRVGRDAKGAQGRGEGCRAPLPCANQKCLPVCSKGHAGTVPRTGWEQWVPEEEREGVTSPSCLAMGELLIALCRRESGPLSFLHGQWGGAASWLGRDRSGAAAAPA